MTNETPEKIGVDTVPSSDEPVDVSTEEQAPAEPVAEAQPATSPSDTGGVIETQDMDVFYGDFKAVADVDMNFEFNEISALIGPSGCGKSTVLRSLNRMNDLIPSAHVKGEVRYHGANIYASGVDPVEIRRRIGMVFQKPNPFPKSIFDNIAWGCQDQRVQGLEVRAGRISSRQALTQAALWDEVKDKLNESGLGHSPEVSSSGSASPGPSPRSRM